MTARKSNASARRQPAAKAVDHTSAGYNAGATVRKVAASAFAHGTSAAKVSGSFLSGFWAGLTAK